ncbi:hypothetical protein [Hahella ganghwensis]|uniref:hypothetical protein n=1 Tax=Hahella ganghwensis TaxID=286420 RepID=UPI0003799350|nr:hypothetical protein [Hahella ganghwensis]
MVAAKKIHDQAIDLVNSALEDIKLGAAIEIASFEEVAENMVDSIFRNHSALTWTVRW